MNSFNQTVRTLLMLAVVGMVGVAGYKGYQVANAPAQQLAERERELAEVRDQLTERDNALAERQKQIDQLQVQAAEAAEAIAELEEARDRLETSLRLLKLRRRLARIEVLDQQLNEEQELFTKFRFYEVGDTGQPIGEPVELIVEGDRIYIEYLVVKFDDKYIEEADLVRGTAICLLERVFGEKQEPEMGYVIDEVGTRPTAYERGTPMNEFEAKIWADFWTIASDPERAAEMGIRAIHAQAPSTKVEAGKVYELDLRATGDFSLTQVKGEVPQAIE
jgi:hypothetical protein